MGARGTGEPPPTCCRKGLTPTRVTSRVPHLRGSDAIRLGKFWIGEDGWLSDLLASARSPCGGGAGLGRDRPRRDRGGGARWRR